MLRVLLLITLSIFAASSACADSVVADIMEYADDTAAQAAYVSNSLPTGGTVTTSGGNTVHTFSSNGNFNSPVAGNVTVQCWGGGGGGYNGDANGGGKGGGGGGYASSTIAVTASTNYAVVVGTGGAASSNGTASTWAATVVVGDYGDGGTSSTTGGGGGGTTNTGTTTANGGTGGNGNGTSDGGGGGGGAGGPSGAGNAGSAASTSTGGDGGRGDAGTGGIGGVAGNVVDGGVGGWHPDGGGGGGGGDNGTGGGQGGTPGGGGGGGETPDSIASNEGADGRVVVTYVTSNFHYLQAYAESTIKTEGSYSLKGVAAITGSLNKTLTHYFAPTGGAVTMSGTNTVHTFSANGNFNSPVAGNVTVECWGGGGGGFDGTSSGGGKGGGGGGYARSTIAVTAATDYAVVVGTGGTAGSNGTQSTWATNVVVGDNGDGGTSATTGGGGGGTNNTGDTTANGGNGGNGDTTNDAGGGGGGAGGTDGAGQVGTNASDTEGGSGGPGDAGAGGIGGTAGDATDGGVGESHPLGGGGGGGGDNAQGGGVGGVPGGGGGGGEVPDATATNAGADGRVVVTYTTSSFRGSIDLTGKNYLLFDMRASRTGSHIKFGLHDTGGTTTEITPNVASVDTWQTVVWDLSAVSDANKDAVDSIIITIVNADSANTFYVDNMGAMSDVFGPGHIGRFQQNGMFGMID